MKINHLEVLLISLILLSLNSTNAREVFDSVKYTFRTEVITDQLQHPGGMAFLPDGDILVTERPGRLRIIKKGRLLPEPVNGLPEIREIGQSGLLDVALHPQFAKNKWVYLSFAGQGQGGYDTEVIRGRLEGMSLKDVKIIFTALPKVGGGRHFGSRLLLASDGKLFITPGDRGEQDRAQQLSEHPGSLIRLDDDGSVPDDNPFVNMKNARLESYTLGNRNMQGIAQQPDTGLLWTHDHGPHG